MKILIDALTAREGGGVTYLRNAIPELQRHRPDWSYTVILSSQYQQSFIEEIGGALNVLPVDVKASPPLQRFRFLRSRVPQLVREGGYDLFFAVAEASVWKTPCPRVVMVRNPNFFSPLNRVDGPRSKMKLLTYKTLWRPIVGNTLRGAHRAVFVSRAFQEDVMQVVPLDKDKCRVVYHGRNPAFTPAPDGDRDSAGRDFILSVSSLARHKDFGTLLKGFARVVDAGRDLDLVIAGAARDPVVHKELLDECARLKIEARVKFLGSVPAGDLPDLYRRARVFVLPSRLETFGHPLVEAMACGSPVVASSLPVCREICRDAARFFSPGDDAGLAAAVTGILDSRDEQHAMGQAGLERAQAFSWPSTARSMTEIFEEVVRAPAPRFSLGDGSGKRS